MSTRRRQIHPEHLFALRDRYVRLAGEIVSAVAENHPDPQKNDHVWINLRAGAAGELQISVSTASRPSAVAGFDPRVRLAILPSTWRVLPPPGAALAEGLDYRALTATNPELRFVAQSRPELEKLLLEKARSAVFAEAWGEFYLRGHPGVHQIHSRRASSAVPRDLVGQDGALQFYFPENRRELLLFQFAGQL